MKKIFFLLLISISLLIGFVLSCHWGIAKNAEGKAFNTIKSLKKNHVGVVLGAAKNLSNGRINPYFKYRVNAAAKLYKAGKVNYLLVSGDNGRSNYDEPSDFKNELIKLGVPANRIYLDYAGFRTLDSMVRSKKIFGQKSITIISQKFHNERAIFLAEQNNINAIAFNAKDLTGQYGNKARTREYLARTKAVIDILLGVEPKFLGKKVLIP